MAKYEITTQPAPIDFECPFGIEERAVQNAKNLLMCRMGEVPFDRQRGLNPALFDLTADELSSALMPELDRVMLWEPAVTVDRAWLTRDAQGNAVIHCIIEIKEE